MSLDHQNQPEKQNLPDITDPEEVKEQKILYDQQINNQYNVDKHITAADIIGTEGLVKVQNDELNIKKIQFRMANELYLRQHPELKTLIQVFLFKVLEEKPDNILSYAGNFFDQQYYIQSKKIQ